MEYLAEVTTVDESCGPCEEKCCIGVVWLSVRYDHSDTYNEPRQQQAPQKSGVILHILKTLDSIMLQEADMVTEVFHGFPRSLQINDGTV
jgi:hypothetical protein